MATTGPETSAMAWIAASFGDKPFSSCFSTASTTTMASSTTSPMASTSPNSERVLTENPRSGKKANVPMRDTGTAAAGIRVARHRLQEDEDHQDDEQEGLPEGPIYLLDPLGDGERRIEGHDVIHVHRETSSSAPP